MRFRPCLYTGLILSALSAAAFAQDDNTLRVLRPVMHAEQEKPELCLEFDHALDSDNGHAQSALKLEADGKSISSQIVVSGSILCLSSLDFRREYRLAVTGLRGANNEKLTEPYHLSFTIPDRHPLLSFTSDQNKDGVLRWSDNDPIVQGINAPHVKIELYRITDPGRMTEAWRQRSQIALAPTESAYFARHNGQLLWQSDIVLDDTPNKMAEQKLPLHAAIGSNLSPGFYLVVASAPAPKNVADNELAPLAASWLLRSNLGIRALPGFDHLYAVTEDIEHATSMKDVRVILEDANQQNLNEGKSDADGIASIAIAPEKIGDATTLMGITENGDVAFTDLTQTENGDYTLPGLTATISTDKDFYAPGEMAELALTAHDIHNHSAVPANSHVDVLRPDGSLYITLPAPKEQNGTAVLRFQTPVGNGNWSLDWIRNDGGKLAEGNLHITTNPEAPRLEITADRAMASEEGDLGLTIKSIADSGKPAAYIAGNVLVAWANPDHVFSGWNDYHFGAGKEDANDKNTSSVSFITDGKGIAQAHIGMPAPSSSDNPLHAVKITVSTDGAAGAADPVPLILPVQPKDFIVGIKPSAPDGKFLENMPARFDVIALDSEGKRRAVDGLSYRIYEEGRSFDWYQTDGRWDYKPQPQEKRIAGGNLAIRSDGANTIEWHGTAGNYRLEILSGTNTVVGRMDFSAVWGTAPRQNNNASPLTLDPSAQAIQSGEPLKIRFKLSYDAMVTAVIADDHIRKVIHQLKKAGDNEIAFTPDTNWGNSIKITVEADAVGNNSAAAGGIVLPSASSVKPQEKPSANRINLPSLETKALPLPIIRLGDQIQFVVTVKNNASAPVSYHYVFNVPSDLKLAGVAGGTLNLTPGQERQLYVTFIPSQAGTKSIKLDITGRSLHTNSNWPLIVLGNNMAFTDKPELAIKPQETWPPKDAKVGKSEGGFVFVSPLPLYNAPQLLATLPQTHAFTTHEITEEMALLRLWHDVIVQSELEPDQALVLRQRRLAIRLLSRQKPDGGFPAVPGGESTMADTATALIGLHSIDFPLAEPAINQSADWLKQRLNNNWFDEKDRPERAAAYVALSASDRLDIATLHHFSDTSADKSLPSLAALQLSAAFAHINDNDKSSFWLNAAHIEKDSGDIEPELLPWLADNYGYDAHNLAPTMEKLSNAISKKSVSISSMSYFMHALAQIQNREGVWRLSANNGEQNLKGIFLTGMPEKTGSLTIHNPGNKTIFVTEAVSAKTIAAKDDSLTRHIYAMTGNEITSAESLKHDETYLVLDEGSWNEDGDSLLLHDVMAPGLSPVSCALGNNIEVSEDMRWVKNFSLSPATTCEKLSGGLNVSLSKKDNGDKTWRIAYLAQAGWRGSFTLLPLQIRSLENNSQPRESRSLQLRVQ